MQPKAPLINQTVLMSGADYFSVEELNPYSSQYNQPDQAIAKAEHATVKQALTAAGVTVTTVPAPPNCQDGVYTANWGLCRGDTVVLASLPNRRQAEEPYAERVLRDLGKHIIKAPYRFSGQGDALPCGNLLFAGSTYRTDSRMHAFLADTLGYDVISLEAVPALNDTGKPRINAVTGWPDSYFYDIDLAIAVIRPDLIAWCPEAFTPASQAKLRALNIDKIEVSLTEARDHFACNLVSTGHTVIMGAGAPALKTALETRGLTVVTPHIRELAKGGGYIRCTSLTIDNM